jgi:hypothetical protein
VPLPGAVDAHRYNAAAMNAASFYVCAGLVVLSCAAAVGLRQPRLQAAAAAAVAIAIGLYLVVAAGEYLLAALEIVLLLGTWVGVTLWARRGGFGPAAPRASAPGWRAQLTAAAPALGVAVLALVVLDGTALVVSSWHQHGLEAGLGGMLRNQAPVTAVILVLAATAAVGVALAVGRVSPDEAELVERRRARQLREERMRRRREDRAAARRRHPVAGSEEAP